MAKLNMVQALNLALAQEMARDERVIVLGEDVGVDGGVFRVSDGLHARFGAGRVLDTPLAESAIVGVAIGMALAGLRPVCEIQFSGFSYQCFHQIENHAARLRWRSRGRFQVPLVLRTPYGGGVRALEHHSESREAFWGHIPGLKLAIPSGPRNARALLVSAMRDPDPVIFYEPTALYRAFREEVPDEEETLPLGKARIARPGKAVTMIAYGAMLRPTLAAAEELSAHDGVEAEVIDLLSLAPLDDALCTESLRKTGRAVVIHEAPMTYGPAAEIAARLMENAFFQMETPIRRIAGYDVVIPLFQREAHYLPDTQRIVAETREVLAA